ncbi:hypothetical protein [Bacillus cereus]|uniref:hypothetical protein n=1 Tax=Bacillus cereus TaxID=1396 RepID=UPI001E36BE3C|nr:hypothetical protein [Bacillus cereus]MCD2337380.1 hypothetical protein [Bacillus cereus]
MITTTIESPNEFLHTLKAVDGTDFIVSAPEVDSLLKRINLSGASTIDGASPSIESLNFYDDLILVPRYKLDRFRKKYKTLQVLRETDHYVWLCRKELFRETVAYNDPSLWNHNGEYGEGKYAFTYEDRLILAGEMSEKLDRQLSKGM